MRVSLVRIFASAVLLPFGAAHAQTHEVKQSVPATDLFAMAEEARASGRQDEAETIYRALTGDPDIELRTEARFRLGLLLTEQGRKRDAAMLFRQILDEKPEASRVRVELARILADLGDVGAASRQLRQVQTGALPPDLAQALDQFATALRSRRPLGASFEIAIAPDSNINRATEARTLNTVIAPLELNSDARSRSGIGLKLAGQAFARVPIGDGLAFLPRISGSGDLYRHGQFNDVSVGAHLGVEGRLDNRNRLTVSGGEGWRWYGGVPYARTHAISADWLHVVSRTEQLTWGVSIARADYRRNPLQDGPLFDTNLAYEQAFSFKSGGSVAIGVTRQSARDPGYSYASFGVTGLYYRDIGGATVFGTASVRRLQGDERLFLFPDRRRDLMSRLTLGGTFRQFTLSGFAPLVRLAVERNRSTIGIYDYRRTAMEIGVTRAF